MKEHSASLFDIDKTLTKDYIIFDIIESEESSGLLRPTTYAHTSIIRQHYGEGKITYEEFVKRLLIEWGRGLKNQSQQDLQMHSEDWVNKNLSKFHDFVPALFQQLANHRNWLVTAEASFVGDAIANKFGASGSLGTIYNIQNGTFTGLADRFLASRQDKAEAIKQLLSIENGSVKIAFGDSDADIDMLELAQYPICINPTAELRKVAMIRKWIICDETNILENTNKLVV